MTNGLEIHVGFGKVFFSVTLCQLNPNDVVHLCIPDSEKLGLSVSFEEIFDPRNVLFGSCISIRS